MLIIDSNFLCYKAMYVMANIPLTTEEKEVEIIFNFLLQILSIVEKTGDNDVIFAWDSVESLRKKAYPNYKRRTDKQTPEETQKKEEAYKQFTELRNHILPAMGFINNFEKAGFEADDIIAVIVKSNPLIPFTIVSTDADMFQLLNHHVNMYNPSKGTYYTKEEFEVDWGIPPTSWPMAKAIAGCKTDTIVGIEGVAEPTACKFLRGELKRGRLVYQRITSPEGQSLIMKNLPLVTLPYEISGILPVDLEKDHLSIRNFYDTFKAYDFQSFITNDMFKKWADAFKLT